jgi:nucleotide-binding universal stress UspA family protein
MNGQERWMVAHDFSECSDAAAFEAARLLAPSRGTMRLLHVHAPVQVRPEQAWGETTVALEHEIGARLEKLAGAVRERHPGVNVEVMVTTGEPVAGILGEAQRSGVDHIVVGTHGRTGVAHLVLGSVAERIVREAPVPVLVVKQAPAAKGIGA